MITFFPTNSKALYILYVDTLLNSFISTIKVECILLITSYCLAPQFHPILHFLMYLQEHHLTSEYIKYTLKIN